MEVPEGLNNENIRIGSLVADSSSANIDFCSATNVNTFSISDSVSKNLSYKHLTFGLTLFSFSLHHLTNFYLW